MSIVTEKISIQFDDDNKKNKDTESKTEGKKVVE